MKRFLSLALAVLMAVGAISAQKTVYVSGNVSIVQESDGWRMCLGENVVAHGDGVLNANNLPPAFLSFVDYYAQSGTVKSLQSQYTCSVDDTPVYGPLLRTAWNQIAPYNNDCPTIDGQRTLTGCTAVSSSQVMNYYGYCRTVDLEGSEVSTHGVVSSPYFSNIVPLDGGGSSYDYSFRLEPDFAKINADVGAMSKFIFGVALAQKADFGVDGTGTYRGDQLSALRNLFGYNVVSKNISSLDDETLIDAIEKCRPVILSGRTAENGGHAFIIDGYNGSEFHVDYGWGGQGNGWFTTTTYPYSNNIMIAYPNDADAAYMRPSPNFLHITGEGVNLLVEMNQHGDNVLQFKQKDAVTLPAGEYAFCFEYADGSTLAPYSDTTIVLRKEYEKVGRFVTTPAKFMLSNTYSLDFWLFANDGSVKIECTDYEMTIAGRVLDEDAQPLSGALVTEADGKPEPAITSACDEPTLNGRYMPVAGVFYDITDFVAEQRYLTRVDVFGWIQGNPGKLTVAVMNEIREVLWQKTIDATQFENFDWTCLELDELLPLEVGEVYIIAFKNETFEAGNYYLYVVDESGNALYRVWTCDDYFVRTDADGAYSLQQEKGWSGALHAYYADKTFNTWTFVNLDENLSDVDFVENGDDETYEGGTTTATDAVPTAGVRVWTEGRRVIVENAASEITVINSSGAVVCKVAPQGVRTAVMLPEAGLYIVRTGDCAEKVMVLR